MQKLWSHVLTTVEPECAQAVQSQMMAQQEGKQPLPLDEVSWQQSPHPPRLAQSASLRRTARLLCERSMWHMPKQITSN